MWALGVAVALLLIASAALAARVLEVWRAMAKLSHVPGKLDDVANRTTALEAHRVDGHQQFAELKQDVKVGFAELRGRLDTLAMFGRPSRRRRS